MNNFTKDLTTLLILRAADLKNNSDPSDNVTFSRWRRTTSPSFTSGRSLLSLANSTHFNLSYELLSELSIRLTIIMKSATNINYQISTYLSSLSEHSKLLTTGEQITTKERGRFSI
jgi:hypothetical protein